MTTRDQFVMVYTDLCLHPKWLGLSHEARSLWTSMLAWSKRMRTYGAVPEAVLAMYRHTPDHAEQLVEAGLWEPSEGGWQFHDWDDHQVSLEEDREVSDKRARAGRKSGETRRSRAKAGTKREQTRADREHTPNTTPTPVPETTTAGSARDTPDTAPDDLFSQATDESMNKAELDRYRDRDRYPSTTSAAAGSTRQSRAFVYPDGFELWWKAYPRKDDKRKALAAWKTATRSVDNAVLIAGAERYRDDQNRYPEYTKLPTTWLNGHCWENGPLPPRGGTSNRPQAGDTHRAMAHSHSAAEAYRALEDSGYYDQAPQITPHMRRTA